MAGLGAQTRTARCAKMPSALGLLFFRPQGGSRLRVQTCHSRSNCTHGGDLGYGGNNPGHAGLPVLVVNTLTLLPLTVRYDLNKALRRLYAARIGSDYDPAVAISNAAALDAIRDVNRIFLFLGIQEKHL